MTGIFAQALREAMHNRKDDLVGKGKTVAELVANIDSATFRTSLSEFLLWLKIDSLLAVLQEPPLEILTEAEYQEIHAYLVPIRITLRREKRSSHRKNEARPDSSPAFCPNG